MMGRIVLLIWALFICLSSARANAKPLASDHPIYAIVIGNNSAPETESDMKPLRYADDDAVRYYQLFEAAAADVELLSVLDIATQRRYPGLSTKSIPPTLANLRRAVDRVSARIHADAEQGHKPVLFITFSGHGGYSARNRNYLALHDGNLTRSVLHNEILATLTSAQVHLLVDACNAGAVLGIRGGKELEARRVKVAKAKRRAIVEHGSLLRFPNVGAIVATTQNRETHEWSRIESGVFTHELISALRGAADINGDLRIEYSEVRAFIAAANRDVTDPRAAPDIKAHPPAGNARAVLLHLDDLRGVSLIHGNPGKLGHFFIELANGQRLLEANIGGDTRLAIAVPAGSGHYLRTDDKEAEIPATTSGMVRLTDLYFRQRASQSRGRIDTVLRTHLFRSSYNRAYYTGFVDSQGMIAVDFDNALRPLYAGAFADLEVVADAVSPLDGMGPARPVAAEVLLNGRPTGTTPLIKGLPAGTYVVQVRYSGTVHQEALRVQPGKTHQVRARFALPPTADEQRRIDAFRARERDAVNRARKADLKDWRKRARPLEEERSFLLLSGLTTLAVGTVLGAVGAVFVAQSMDNRIDELSTLWRAATTDEERDEAQRDVSDAETERDLQLALGLGSLGLGSAAIISGIVMLVLMPDLPEWSETRDRRSTEASANGGRRMRVRPWLSSTRVGASISGKL